MTDANLVLGRLSPRGLLGGRMTLDPHAAYAAIQPMAERLGFSVERTAHGILGVVTANMVRAIRTISVERGHDPRDFALMPFGGAGPLHARDVAVSLGIHRLIVPAAPGILCAQGLVVADLKEDFVIGQRLPVEGGSEATLRGRVAELCQRAATWFAVEQVPPEARRLELRLDLRYVGQNFELAVPFDPLALPDAAGIRERFFAAHETAYGYFNPHDPIEVVNFRLTARGRLHRAAAPAPVTGTPEAPVPFEQREVFFTADRPRTTPVFDRAALRPGQQLVGPAVVEQLDATTLLFPDDRARIDAAGNLLIEIAP